MWVPPPISKKGKGVAWLFAAAWGRHGAVRGAAGGGRRAGQRPRHRPRRPPHPPEAPGPPILPHRPSRDTGRGGRVREARGRGEGSGWGAVLGGANTLPTRPKGGVATNIEVGPFSDSVSPSRRPIPSDGFASRSGVSAHTPPTRTSASTCRPIPWTATTTPRPWDIWGGFGSKLCASSHRPCSAVTDFRIHDNKSRLEVWPKTLSCF